MPNQPGTSISPADSIPDQEGGGAAAEATARVRRVPGGGGARIAPVLAPSSHRYRPGRGVEGGGSRSQSRTKKIGELRLMVTGLLILLMVAAMVAIYYWAKVGPLDAEVLSLATDLSHAQKELDKARELLRTQDSEISAMMTRRIPGVAELTFDNLVNVNDKYLRKLTFNQSGVGQNKVVAFHAVLENKGRAPMLPDVRIHLFDRMGLQTGVVKLGKEHAGGDAALAELRPEETRTYSGPIPAERDAESKYFMVEIR
jgi:hypothetical protein